MFLPGTPELDTDPAQPLPFPCRPLPLRLTETAARGAWTFTVITLIFKLLQDGLILFLGSETILKPPRTAVCKYWGLCVGWIGTYQQKKSPANTAGISCSILRSRSQVPGPLLLPGECSGTVPGSAPEKDPLSVWMFASPQLSHLISCFLLSTNTHYWLLNSLIKHHTASWLAE